MDACIGNFTVTSGSTSNINVTLPVGNSWTPQVLILFHNNTNSTALKTGDNIIGFGMCTAANSVGWCMGEQDNVGTTDANHQLRTDGCVVEVNRTGAITGRVAFSAFSAGGFTLTIPDAFVNTTIVGYVAMGNLTGAFLDVNTLPGATGNFDITTAGFQPDLVLNMCFNTSTLATSTVSPGLSIGWASSSSARACMQLRAVDAVTADYSLSGINTSLMGALIPAAAYSPTLDFVSFLANGVRINKVVGASTPYRATLMLRGGVPTIGTTTTSVTTGAKTTINTPNTVPKLALFMTRPPATASDATAVEPYECSFSVATSGSSRGSLWWHHYDAGTLGLTDPLSRLSNQRILPNYDRTGTDTVSTIGYADIDTWGSSSIVLNQVDGDAQASLVAYLVYGDDAATANTSAAWPDRRRRTVATL